MGSLAIARLSVLEALRRKELYVVLVLTMGLAAWMQFMDLKGVGAARFTKDIVMQVTWLVSFALAVPMAARQITSDIEQKTVYVLMSRPIHRWHYVLGRALGAAFAAVTCFACLYSVLVLTLLLKGGASIGDPSLWQAFALQALALVLLSTVTVLLSTCSTPSAAVTFSLILLIVMRYGGPSILARVESTAGLPVFKEALWFVYLALPHFEFFDITQRVVHGWGPLPVVLFGQILVYGVAYSVVAAIAASLVFRRRWL